MYTVFLHFLLMQFFLMFLHLHLYLVESLAIYTDYATLADECAWVDCLNESED